MRRHATSSLSASSVEPCIAITASQKHLFGRSIRGVGLLADGNEQIGVAQLADLYPLHQNCGPDPLAWPFAGLLVSWGTGSIDVPVLSGAVVATAMSQVSDEKETTSGTDR